MILLRGFSIQLFKDFSLKDKLLIMYILRRIYFKMNLSIGQGRWTDEKLQIQSKRSFLSYRFYFHRWIFYVQVKLIALSFATSNHLLRYVMNLLNIQLIIWFYLIVHNKLRNNNIMYRNLSWDRFHIIWWILELHWTHCAEI